MWKFPDLNRLIHRDPESLLVERCLCLSLILIAWMLSLDLVEKLILNFLHLLRFSWNLSFEVFLPNTSTALCIELDWFFATTSQIVVSSTYFYISMFGVLRSLIMVMNNLNVPF